MSPDPIDTRLRALTARDLRILDALDAAEASVATAELADRLSTTLGALANRLAVLLAAGFARPVMRVDGTRAWIVLPAGRKALALARAIEANPDFNGASPALRRHVTSLALGIA